MCDCRTVLGSHTAGTGTSFHKLAANVVNISVPFNRIDVSGISDNNRCCAVGLDGLCFGFLECEVVRIKIVRRIFISDCFGYGVFASCFCCIRSGSEVGVSVIIRILNHVYDFIVDVSCFPLRVDFGAFIKREGIFCFGGALRICIPAQEVKTASGCFIV